MLAHQIETGPDAAWGGDFPPGSMGPKIQAIHEFLESGGKRGLVTDPEHLVTAVDGRAGTHFVGRI